MAGKNRTPEENTRREKTRELLQMASIGSMDDIRYHARSEGQIVRKGVYIAIGIDPDGKKMLWACGSVKMRVPNSGQLYPAMIDITKKWTGGDRIGA